MPQYIVLDKGIFFKYAKEQNSANFRGGYVQYCDFYPRFLPLKTTAAIFGPELMTMEAPA